MLEREMYNAERRASGAPGSGSAADAGRRRLHAFVRQDAFRTPRGRPLDKTGDLLDPQRRIDRLDERGPAPIRMVRRARLELIHHIAEAQMPVHVGKPDRAPVPPMPEGLWMGAKRLVTK